VNAGDTFFLTDRSVDEHLWVIISDPALDAERVLFVSMTTYRPPREPACMLHVGDHALISHASCIAYEFARVTSNQQLEDFRAHGHLEMKEPVSPEILSRIRRGVSLSKRIPVAYLELMLEQNLLD
jgi:hypothetical protein